jgi:hypothetical protein
MNVRARPPRRIIADMVVEVSGTIVVCTCGALKKEFPSEVCPKSL